MSVLASTFYKDLVAQGVDESRARAFAVELDKQAAELLRQSREHADNAIVAQRERADAKYVSREEYHARDRELATRADLSEIRKDFRFWMAILFTFLTPVFVAAVKIIFLT